MQRKILVVLSAVTFIVGVNKLSFAQTYTEARQGVTETSKKTVSEEAVNVGNKICPVSGEKVGQGGMEPATYEYKGKIYNFCCAGCINNFKKDPGKYIKKIEEEKLAGTTIK